MKEARAIFSSFCRSLNYSLNLWANFSIVIESLIIVKPKKFNNKTLFYNLIEPLKYNILKKCHQLFWLITKLTAKKEIIIDIAPCEYKMPQIISGLYCSLFPTTKTFNLFYCAACTPCIYCINSLSRLYIRSSLSTRQKSNGKELYITHIKPNKSLKKGEWRTLNVFFGFS